MDVYSNDKVAEIKEPKMVTWVTIQAETLEAQRQTIDQLTRLERFLFSSGDDFDIPSPACTEHALVLTKDNAVVIRDRMQEILARIGVSHD